MDWLVELLDQLARQPLLGYSADQPTATEPTALAVLALAGHGRLPAADRAIHWLLAEQAADGSVGVRQGEPEPRWPTSLAVLAWNAARRDALEPSRKQLDAAVERGVEWLLGCSGSTFARDPDMGHDTTLKAWPWIEGTHSWIEPTALGVLALKSAGQGAHDRTREAVRLLIDRLLPTGGCNYGNTQVLGQTLRPQLLPTGLAIAALAAETDSTGRVDQSIRFLRRTLDERTATMSLTWSLIGLAMHQAAPEARDEWLASAWKRLAHGGRRAPGWWLMPLVALAQLGDAMALLGTAPSTSATAALRTAAR